jgi:hypothetical protein
LTGPNVDQAEQRQGSHCLAQTGSADLQGLGEVALGKQAVPWPKFPGGQLVREESENVFENLRLRLGDDRMLAGRWWRHEPDFPVFRFSRFSV